MQFNSNFDFPNFGHSEVTLSTDYLRTISFIDENNLLESLNFQQPEFLSKYQRLNARVDQSNFLALELAKIIPSRKIESKISRFYRSLRRLGSSGEDER